jgi:hypothetical protein
MIQVSREHGAAIDRYAKKTVKVRPLFGHQRMCECASHTRIIVGARGMYFFSDGQTYSFIRICFAEDVT